MDASSPPRRNEVGVMWAFYKMVKMNTRTGIVVAAGFLFFGAYTNAEKSPESSVLLGIDVLEGQGYALLKGKQVGLITNQTGVDLQGRSTADLLAKAPGVKLVALFS